MEEGGRGPCAVRDSRKKKSAQSYLPWGLGEVRGLSNWGGVAGLDSKVGRFAGREREVRGYGGRRKGAVRRARLTKKEECARSVLRRR